MRRGDFPRAAPKHQLERRKSNTAAQSASTASP